MDNITNEKYEVPNKISEKEKNQNTTQIFQNVSGAFLPLMPILAGSGMLNSLILILIKVGILSENIDIYFVLSATGNGVFYFLPIFLGITLSKQLGANPYVGGAIGAALLEPNFTKLIGDTNTNLLGVTFRAIDYSTTVFPVFLITFFYAFLEKRLKKIIHQDLQLFLVPMICLLIVVPISVLFFAPFGNEIGNQISNVVMQLFQFCHFLAGAVLGIIYPILMIFGLHWGFTPITVQNLSTYGGDVIEGVGVCCVYAQLGIAMALYLKEKENKNKKSILGANILTGFLAGVTEPILYGFIVKDRILLFIVAISSGIGGVINSTLGVTMNAYVFHNIISIFMMSYSPLLFFFIGISCTFLIGFLLTYFLCGGIK